MTAALWKIAGRALGFVIPIPLVLLLAALAWLHFDKSSAIRLALNNQAKTMIAGAEIAALKSERDAERIIADAQNVRAKEAVAQAQAYLAAQTQLAIELSIVRETNQGLQNELDDMESLPPPADCRVDDALIDRLRKR